jgi:hypothetical protein
VKSHVFQWQCKPPTITQQPFLQTNNSLVSITISAIGASPLTYEWYKDNQPILSATNSSLLLTNSGSFYAIITNSAGTATSAPVQWNANLPKADKDKKKGESKKQSNLADPEILKDRKNNTAGGQTNHLNGTHP